MYSNIGVGRKPLINGSYRDAQVNAQWDLDTPLRFGEHVGVCQSRLNRHAAVESVTRGVVSSLTT